MNLLASGLALEIEMLGCIHCVLHLGILPTNGRGLVHDRILAVGCKCDSQWFVERHVLVLRIGTSPLDFSECP